MPDTPNNDPAWERKIIEKLALEALTEQRRRRRWGIFFKVLGFAYLTLLIVIFGDWGETAEKLGDGKKHTAMVQLNGVIKSSGEASAEKVMSALQSAFEDKGTQGIILRINSPGGSPVQSGIINDEIKRLRAKHPGIPLYAVIEDVCASGGYYVAAAAD
ncbi:MAG: S49 family peptidase, partial [Rhodocyclaceae bacterium]|nr:S49 family peptidase [Rhodocyclaceae bacterium]